QPTSVQSFALAAKLNGNQSAAAPIDPVVTNDGTVYYTTTDEVIPNYSCGGLYRLNTSTGTLTYEPNVSGASYAGGTCFLNLSSDGSRIYYNIGGDIGYFDIPTQTAHESPLNVTDLAWGTDELALSPNQDTLFASGLIVDSGLNGLGMQSLNLPESIDAVYVYGAAISADGGLIFQPGDGFIDVFDGRTGSFRSRISLPFPLSPNFRALVSNNRDSKLLAITGSSGNGIAVIDLNSLPEPQPLPYPLLKNQTPQHEEALASPLIHSAVDRSKRRASHVAPPIRHLTSPLRFHNTPLVGTQERK
ncbi:MAG TPA: hypothetical protein VHD85_20420, partial [Terracidiphilus sp.]|nr:hypothetical protein [Terracidiphilus sp.]